MFSSHRFARVVPEEWDEVKRFGELAKRSVVVVVPDQDPVPRVDQQIGMVQNVECRRQNGVMPYPWECHPIKKTACEIWRVCGDTYGRDFRYTCNNNTDAFYVDPDNTGALYEDNLYDTANWVR